LWLAVVALLLSVVACGGGGGGRATPTPAPVLTITPPGPGEGTVTPTPPGPETEYWLVYREFGAQQDTIWRVRPQDTASREQVAVIAHSDGCGVRASLSPDGRMLAYTVQPPGTPCLPDNSTAHAHVIDLLRKEDEKIAEGIDLRFTPLWDPEGGLLYLRRYAGAEFLNADVSILRVKVQRKALPGKETPEPTAPTPVPQDPVTVILQDKVSTVLSFIPIGFAPDRKTMYFIQVQGGTTVATLAGAYAPATSEAVATAEAEAGATATALANETATAGGTVEPGATLVPPVSPTPPASFVVKLSDQLISEPNLSSDGSRLAFVAQQLVEGEPLDRVFVADLTSKTVAPLGTEDLPPGHHLSPVWHPDGQRLAVGTLPRAGEPGAVALVPVAGGPPSFLTPPAAGFDRPLSWSPDGKFLAAYSFSGESLVNPGSARLELLAITGQRATVAEGADLLVIGWWKPAPPE